MDSDLRVLVISGSMGSGKTTVLNEASDLLKVANVVHAAFDLDQLSIGFFPSAPESFAISNLMRLWSGYEGLGVRRVLISEAIETRGDREALRLAFKAHQFLVCRLIARIETMQERVRLREPGIHQGEFVARVVELDRILAAAKVEDFCVENENRSVTEVAREILTRAKWI
jgi:hypothetical protein